MADLYAEEIHPKHRYAPIVRDGLEVPETAIALDDSPTGPNPPLKVYRTRGPWAEPEDGLPTPVSYTHLTLPTKA